MVNASFMSMMQAKTPPDVQGRIFAALGQVSMFLMPISYLLSGPLADHVFEPAVGGAGWDTVAPLMGTQAGAGMGLMMFLAGTGIALVTLAVYALPAIRNLESSMPDYAPVAAHDGAASDEVRGDRPATPATAG